MSSESAIPRMLIAVALVLSGSGFSQDPPDQPKPRKIDPDKLRQAREGLQQREKRAGDATRTGAGTHKVREIEFPIPAERWQREMAVRVYFPEKGGPYPLVVFCAGSGGGNDTYADTSIFLASHGFAVLHTSYRPPMLGK